MVGCEPLSSFEGGQHDSGEDQEKEDCDRNVGEIGPERQSPKETGGDREEQRILPETRTDYHGQLVGH